MKIREREYFRLFARGASLRRRVAYSLAIVRLVLVPVIFLAIYYLFEMGWIVDRIVSVDAPAATLAQQASIEMLEARRAERNYLLLHDSSYLQANARSVMRIREILSRIEALEPDEQSVTKSALEELNLYQQRFAAAVSTLELSGQASTNRIQTVVQAYERDLNNLLREASFKKRSLLVEEVRSRVASFDTQISKTIQEGDPALRQVTLDLQNSSDAILRGTSELETRNWTRVREDHRQARHLINQAEWALGIVSALTFLLSMWISFILPRQVVMPLLTLKEAVDQAATGNYQIKFDIQGEGEVVQLANSFRNLVANISRKG